jgi:hypothetical protein
MGNHLLVMVSSQAGIEWKEEGAINQRCIHGVHRKDGFRSLHCSYSKFDFLLDRDLMAQI